MREKEKEKKNEENRIHWTINLNLCKEFRFFKQSFRNAKFRFVGFFSSSSSSSSSSVQSTLFSMSFWGFERFKYISFVLCWLRTFICRHSQKCFAEIQPELTFIYVHNINVRSILCSSLWFWFGCFFIAFFTVFDFVWRQIDIHQRLKRKIFALWIIFNLIAKLCRNTFVALSLTLSLLFGNSI